MASLREPHHAGDYNVLSQRATPHDWKPGAVWTLVTTMKSGISESLTFRVMDEIAETCSGGTWRKLQVISGRVPQLGGKPTQTAYSAGHSFLVISVLAPWCDIDDYIHGRLKGKTFTGNRTQGGMMGSERVGTVRGWRVK